MSLTIPANLAAAAEREGRRDWLASLPTTIEMVSHRWRIVVSEPFQPGGATAWVAPATGAEGQDLVLKLGWPHLEATHEADGLRLWAGHGAVLLHAAEDLDHTMVLLVERCRPGLALSTLPEPDQDVVIGSLLRRLWRDPRPDHPFRPLQEMCDQWAVEFEAKAATGLCPLEPRLAQVGVALLRELPSTAAQHVVLCTDLHAGNVLGATREPWLAIDPKPYVGDPAYDLVQHMLNCADRLQSDPLALCDRMADLVGLERHRTRHWLLARCVQESCQWPGLAEVARRMAPS